MARAGGIGVCVLANIRACDAMPTHCSYSGTIRNRKQISNEERADISVLTALDGLTGIALTRNHTIDAIVLDFNMAGMDGSAVAQALMKEHPRLPVVVCSGCLDDIPESLKWYADALLEKTDGPEALISTIEELTNTTISTYGKRVRTN